MDGNVAVQRATAWWESFGSDSAWRAPEALAGLITDLAAAIDGSPDRIRATNMLAGLGDLVTTRAQGMLDRVAATLLPKPVDGASGDRFRMVFDNAAVAIAVATGEVESTIIDVNPAFAKMFNRAAELLRGIPIAGFANLDKLSADLREWITLVESGGGTRRFEAPYRRADGTLGWALFIMTFVPQTAAESSYVLAVAEDITGQRSRADELQWQAHHDALTGLPNRRFLQEELRSAADSAAGHLAGLCFIDLDDFTSVNDSYGHTVGDRILCEIADRLGAVAKEAGHVVVRLGGDEFVVLAAPPASEAEVVAFAERLLTVLDDPIEIDETLVQVQASVGVDLVDLAGTDLDKVLEGADKALYRTKAEGRGVVVFDR